MYKPKPYADCEMPANADLNVLALNGSLKHEPDISNTDELTRVVIANMGATCKIKSEVIRLSDTKLPVGLGFRESDYDDWPALVDKIKAADVMIFATPVWWGGRS